MRLSPLKETFFLSGPLLGDTGTVAGNSAIGWCKFCRKLHRSLPINPNKAPKIVQVLSRAVLEG
jgi:hypothetical protein